MATKSITIDLEAYERLKAARRENESFSQTIKRVVPKPFDVEAWLKRASENPLSQETIDAVEERLRERRGGPKRKQKAG